MSARFVVGDVFDVLATLEPASVDLICTSPPFLALRSYLPAEHPDKAREIGSEATPGMFIDRMLDVVEACARVLAPHGSLVFELGDTYAGSGGAGGDYNDGGLRDGAPGFDGSARASRFDGRDSEYGTGAAPRPSRTGRSVGWPLDKSKVLIPQLFAIALAYGFNPLTGRQTEPWRVRNTVAWCRPNPPVGRDGDKFRPATSFLTIACKARDRYWDGDAVRTVNHPERMERTDSSRGGAIPSAIERWPEKWDSESGTQNPAGAPLLDYWVIPTEPFRGAHYATFPRALVVPLVKALCPARVCRVCGKPSERITQPSADYAAIAGTWDSIDGRNAKPGDSGAPSSMRSNGRGGLIRQNDTLGWSDCGHNDWRPGLVLDPFAGSGTTLSVATGHGFDCVGIDLDSRNVALASDRVGMFLTVEYLNETGTEGDRSDDPLLAQGQEGGG